METHAVTSIEYLDLYRSMLAHQRRYDSPMLRSWPGREEQPHWTCLHCVREGRRPDYDGETDVRRRFSFAIPTEQALETIARYSPGGVVEIGAGGGYWAMLLQQRGVDVIAYDPVPVESEWHCGGWTAVHEGDHWMAGEHPARTLMVCWPSYGEPWAAEAVECYRGDTVIYIGEGNGGCTADDRFHVLLGAEPYCWHTNDEGVEVSCPEACPSNATALFREVDSVAIPQWAGIHDRLGVYRRIGTTQPNDHGRRA